jgi:hypothetical protein
MRSLGKLFAYSAVGATCAFLSFPAHANTSSWDHNGSTLVLEENGKKRKLVYAEPRGALDGAGVKRGTVLFDGEEKADGRLAGYAKLFRAGCDPVDYFVEGSFDKSKGEILLQGQAPIYSGNGCKITGYSDDNTASTLKFNEQGGGTYASRADQAQPDAGSGNSYHYNPPQDGAVNRDDPASADPRSADPRYGDSGGATDPRYDPRYDDPRYDPRYGDRGTDPRGYSRYGERDYADRQSPYARFPGRDRYYARRPNPDDPDADALADENEDDEPAYIPYRPFWRWGN